MRSCANSVSLVLREVGRNRRGVAVACRLCTTVEKSLNKQKHPQRHTKAHKGHPKSLNAGLKATTSHDPNNPVSIAEEKRNIIRNTIRTSYMFKIPDTLLQSYDDAVYATFLLFMHV